MFIVLLKFSDNKTNAGQYMDGHNAWLKSGFDDGVFILAGTLQPKQGGAIVTNTVERSDLEKKISEDPFVIENIVTAEILEITPGKADERLKFLLT